MKVRNLIPALAFAFLALFPSLAMAQSGVSAFTSWKCTFPISVFVDWRSGNPSPELDQQEMIFNIDNVQLGEGFGTARFIGNNGSSNLIVYTNGMDSAPINFMEITGGGLLNLITVFSAPGPSLSEAEWGFDSLGRRSFKATYSRHSEILGDPLPSQQYGFCVAWE